MMLLILDTSLSMSVHSIAVSIPQIEGVTLHGAKRDRSRWWENSAPCGSRTRPNSLEGCHASRYTNGAHQTKIVKNRYIYVGLIVSRFTRGQRCG